MDVPREIRCHKGLFAVEHRRSHWCSSSVDSLSDGWVKSFVIFSLLTEVKCTVSKSDRDYVGCVVWMCQDCWSA